MGEIFEGWVLLHRKIKDSWIWESPPYLKAWLTIILTVNYTDNKVIIQGTLYQCKRGQSLLSVCNWAKAFGKGWTRQRVRTFFTLLVKDHMITIDGLQKQPG